MFSFRQPAPPLPTFQRVDIELLLRRNIEAVGAKQVAQSDLVVNLDELHLDLSNQERLLDSAIAEVRRRLPVKWPDESAVAIECTVVDAEELAHPSTYQPATGDAVARISISDETIRDPLRTVMELAYQHSNHFWHSKSQATELDVDARNTNLLPICCGLGVLASEASLYDQQWTQAGWTGWSLSRSGYYSAMEIGYSLALLARARGEANPQWVQSLRLDSKVTAEKAWRYFEHHQQQDGQLLFDADRIPHSGCDPTELGNWLRGKDMAFALAAGYALQKQSELPAFVVDAAIVATHAKDAAVVPLATRLLGQARSRNPQSELRVKQLISNSSPQTSLAAIESANALGMPLIGFGRKIGKLLDQFAEDSFTLLTIIGEQGQAFGFLAPKICEHIARAIVAIDEELTQALLICLQKISDDPQQIIEQRIRPENVRSEALQRLALTT